MIRPARLVRLVIQLVRPANFQRVTILGGELHQHAARKVRVVSITLLEHCDTEVEAFAHGARVSVPPPHVESDSSRFLKETRVRMSHGSQHIEKEPNALPDVELLPFAIPVDVLAGDVFQNQIRLASG
jgi:hypothetical protein